MKELIEKKHLEDEQKLLNAIHKNCKDKQMENSMNMQLNAIKLNEKRKKEKRARRIEFAVLISAAVILLVAFKFLTDKKVKDCMDAGHSEVFCRYAGE